jgi:hypothetical protein
VTGHSARLSGQGAARGRPGRFLRGGRVFPAPLGQRHVAASHRVPLPNQENPSQEAWLPTALLGAIGPGTCRFSAHDNKSNVAQWPVQIVQFGRPGHLSGPPSRAGFAYGEQNVTSG